MKLYTLRWGLERRRFASFARLDTLVQYFRESVKNHPEHRRWKNALLSVRETGVESTRLSAAEVEMLVKEGLMKEARAE
jgi:hypothetical protein